MTDFEKLSYIVEIYGQISWENLRDDQKIAWFSWVSENIEHFELQRLYYWLIDEKREPAKTKFTSGTLRNVAREIEYMIGK